MTVAIKKSGEENKNLMFRFSLEIYNLPFLIKTTNNISWKIRTQRPKVNNDDILEEKIIARFKKENVSRIIATRFVISSTTDPSTHCLKL